MKSHLTIAISVFCLSAGLLGLVAGSQASMTAGRDEGSVASEYNPPGRGGAYPGGTRFDQRINADANV